MNIIGLFSFFRTGMEGKSKCFTFGYGAAIPCAGSVFFQSEIKIGKRHVDLLDHPLQAHDHPLDLLGDAVVVGLEGLGDLLKGRGGLLLVHENAVALGRFGRSAPSRG